MNRFVLTLLALLTGLAAQVSPAHAAVRQVGEAEIGSVQTVRAAVRLARQAAVFFAHAGVAHVARLRDAAPFVPLEHVVPAGTRIGIDRARE